MSTDDTLPAELSGRTLDAEEARRLLAAWHHPRPDEWVAKHVAPPVRAEDLWRELLEDECDKLYNQAWCALDQIRSAEDPESVMFLAIDDFPSAVELAFSLAPTLAAEHLQLLREYKEERYREFEKELAVGTDREVAERIECLEFWEENAEDMSDLRKTLCRLVREGLRGGSG
jgi:HEAT repeat protein